MEGGAYYQPPETMKMDSVLYQTLCNSESQFHFEGEFLYTMAEIQLELGPYLYDAKNSEILTAIVEEHGAVVHLTNFTIAFKPAGNAAYRCTVHPISAANKALAGSI